MLASCKRSLICLGGIEVERTVWQSKFGVGNLPRVSRLGSVIRLFGCQAAQDEPPAEHHLRSVSGELGVKKRPNRLPGDGDPES